MNKTPFLRYVIGLVMILVSVVSVGAQSEGASKAVESDANKLVYADFQTMHEGRLVSNRGGHVRLNHYAQNMANPPQYKGLANGNPPGPAPTRVSADDIAAGFEYELRMPNEWSGVNMEIFGQPEKDGKFVADDISEYKFITLRVHAKGATSVRIELITRGHGSTLESGYPLVSLKLKEGFHTYKFKLDSFEQPSWATPRLDLKRDVLKKLTSITIGVSCDQCRMQKGLVVVDNITFEK